MLLLLTLACAADKTEAVDSWSFPDIDAAPDLRGPGGPAVEFESDELFVNCAPLLGGESDILHHNLVLPYRGHLVMPWTPEWGNGGLSFFEMNDPCNPVKVGEGQHNRMRESHAIGFMHFPETHAKAGDYAVTSGILGLQFWDLSVLESPEMINYLQIEGVFYPDSYTRVVLSVFWQYPYVYVAAADNGIFIVDASDPENPETVGQYIFEPPLRAAAVYAMGDQLFVSAAEGSEAEILDISDPTSPQPIPGGRFTVTDETGRSLEAYHASLTGDWALFARKEDGGGVIIFDVSDPQNPKYHADVWSESGNGGYVYYDEGYAFLGDSHWAKVYDMRDMNNIVEVGTGYLEGDLDTITPFGNVAAISVDEDAVDGIATMIMPWTEEVDLTGPKLLRTVPADGAIDVPVTARIGLGFNEMIEPTSIFAGSVRLYDSKDNAIDGWGMAQETIAHYVPKTTLKPGETYRVEVLEGGARDINNNAIEETVFFQFTTAGVNR